MRTAERPANKRPDINVFTYGSLMYADVFEQVAGCLPLSMPARAYRWQRYGLKGLTYPGACPAHEQDRFIDGVMWLNVGEAALEALDRFEGEQYRRVQITVTVECEKPCFAHIYQWLLPELVQGNWDPMAFEREHRQGFAQTHGARQD